jgi:hypothetical protein
LASLGITATEPGFREQDQPATSPMELHYIRKHASLSVFFGQHSGTGLFALRHALHITVSRDSKEIQEIQRIKNIITFISLKKMGQTQVDVRKGQVIRQLYYK